MIHELCVLILGQLPDTSLWLYDALDFILAIVLISLIISPFVLLIKVLGGK